jgi:transposase
MRIIGNIEHPHMKISVFRMDNRWSVKFENEWYEQTFKIGSDTRLEDLESIKNLIDPAFQESVLQTFQQMHQTRLQGYGRAFPVSSETAFEDII